MRVGWSREEGGEVGGGGERGEQRAGGGGRPGLGRGGGGGGRGGVRGRHAHGPGGGGEQRRVEHQGRWRGGDWNETKVCLEVMSFSLLYLRGARETHRTEDWIVYPFVS